MINKIAIEYNLSTFFVIYFGNYLYPDILMMRLTKSTVWPELLFPLLRLYLLYDSGFSRKSLGNCLTYIGVTFLSNNIKQKVTVNTLSLLGI